MDSEEGKILLVEDEEAILFAFKRVLSGPGVVIDTAQSLEEAKAALQANYYHAVIADLRLTGATVTEGFEVIKETRKTQTDCKIIIVTAYGNTSTRETVFELGADFYLEKPVSAQKVKEILKSMGVLPA